MDLAILIDKYGLPTVSLLLLLTQTKNIVTFIEQLLSKIWPTFAEHQRLKLERLVAADERMAEQQRLKLEKMAADSERVDTILALKDMLLAYRQELDDSKLERRQLQNRLYDLVAQYERRDAQVIDVLRDISEAIRSQTNRLDRISVKAGVYNHGDKMEYYAKEKGDAV